MPENEQKPAFYASRPNVYVDGELREALGSAQLLSVIAEETTRGLSRCEARFRNWGPKGNQVDFLHFDRDTFDFGKEFEIELGAPGSKRVVFSGRISGLEGLFPGDRPPEIVVLAEDRFQDLRMTRRTRTFEDVTDADVFSQIAQDHSLTPQIDIEGPTHAVLVQSVQSDLAFLRERAAAVDAEIWVEDGALHAQPRGNRDAGTVELAYGANLLEATFAADLAHQRSAVRVSGWDVDGKTAIEEDARTTAVGGELESGEAGADVLSSAFADRTEVEAVAALATVEEARSLAEAMFRHRARRFVRGRLVADGESGLRVGAFVELTGLGSLFDGRYYVARARHVFDLKSGYRSIVDVERPGLGGW
jgi:hypothetical protein